MLDSLIFMIQMVQVKLLVEIEIILTEENQIMEMLNNVDQWPDD